MSTDPIMWRIDGTDPLAGTPCWFCGKAYEGGDVLKAVPGGPKDDAELARAAR